MNARGSNVAAIMVGEFGAGESFPAARKREHARRRLSFEKNVALRVFDLRLPLDDVAKGYAAMDERRAVKVDLDVGR